MEKLSKNIKATIINNYNDKLAYEIKSLNIIIDNKVTISNKSEEIKLAI